MTTEWNEYSAEEALRIALRTRDELSYVARAEARAARTRAADRLLTEAVALFSGHGFQDSKDESGNRVLTLLKTDRSNGATVVLRNEGGEVLIAGKRADLDMDPVTGKLEGTSADTFFVQVPGEPIRKRSALAVVAELVSTCMRESAKS